MEDMKGDMAGGAAVIEGIGAIAELGLPVRVIAVVAATENMPGGGAYRPGDILTAMNGKTIEVINTDAEGRLVLADALTYAREQGATHIVDFATLTGVMEAALGDLYAGVFGNDDDWRDRVVEAGEASGDHAWPLPLHDRFRRYIDSQLRGHEELLDPAPGRARCWPPSSCRSSPARARGPTSTWPAPAFFRWPRPDYLWQKGGTGYGVRLITELAGRLVRMNFDLSPEHELVRTTVREFAEERVAPVAEELDREHRFPYELVARAGRARPDGHADPGGVRRRRHATRSPTRSRSRS